MGCCCNIKKIMVVELNYCIFNIGLWFQVLDRVYNIAHTTHQLIEHHKLGVFIPLHGFVYIVDKSLVHNDKGHQIANKNISTMDQLGQTLHYLTHKSIPK